MFASRSICPRTFANHSKHLADAGPTEVLLQVKIECGRTGQCPTLKATMPFINRGCRLTLRLTLTLFVGGKRPRFQRQIQIELHHGAEAGSPSQGVHNGRLAQR